MRITKRFVKALVPKIGGRPDAMFERGENIKLAVRLNNIVATLEKGKC